MKCIDVKHVRFAYQQDNVLDDLNFSMEKGDLFILVGENGSGKSTLVKLILGELKPQSGSIEILGTPIDQLKSFKKIGYLPQVNVMEKIAFPITSRELIALGLYDEMGLIKIPGKKIKERSYQALEDAGLGMYADLPFNELSGGLQQRVMICRAQLHEPELLILDEPTAGVDEQSKIQFFQLVMALSRQGLSILLVTHELDLALEYLENAKVLAIKGGRIEHVSL